MGGRNGMAYAGDRLCGYMQDCTLDLAARRFVLGLGAGAVSPARPPTSRIVCRMGHAAVTAATVTQYAARRDLALGDALRTAAVTRAYAMLQPTVSADVFTRTAHFWRWSLEHSDWDLTHDAYVVLSTTGDYRWASHRAAELLGFPDAGAVLERGRAGWQDPAERAVQETLVRIAQAGPVAWRMDGARGPLRLHAEPLHDDEGEAVAILARFDTHLTPTLPLLPIQAHPAPNAPTPAPRVLVHA